MLTVLTVSKYSKFIQRVKCKKSSNAPGVLVGREVEMVELMPKVRQKQCIVLETDRKSVSVCLQHDAAGQYVGATEVVVRCSVVSRLTRIQAVAWDSRPYCLTVD